MVRLNHTLRFKSLKVEDRILVLTTISKDLVEAVLKHKAEVQEL